MLKKSAAIILAAAIAATLAGCKKSDTEDEIRLPIYGAAEVSYEVAEAKIMDITETESMGAIIGYPFADSLCFPAEAQITEFSAVKGREIKEGDILAQLDSGALDYDISNQQTIVNTAYAASLSGGEAARLNYEIEKYTLDMMLAEKESYIIRAPYDGIITGVNRKTVGSTAEKGAVCCTVAPKNGAMVYVEGRDVNKFVFGQDVKVRLDGEDYPAIVAQAPDIAPETADGNSLKRAIFKFEDGIFEKIIEENPMVISAGWATVYITTERKNVLAVPNSAVKTTGSYSYVTLVDGDERFKLEVTVGQSLGGNTEIIDGIAEGDIVMSEGSGMFTEAAEDKTDEDGWGE